MRSSQRPALTGMEARSRLGCRLGVACGSGCSLSGSHLQHRRSCSAWLHVQAGKAAAPPELLSFRTLAAGIQAVAHQVRTGGFKEVGLKLVTEPHPLLVLGEGWISWGPCPHPAERTVDRGRHAARAVTWARLPGWATVSALAAVLCQLGAVPL